MRWAAVLAVLGLLTTAAPSRSDPAPRLRVVTFNLFHGGPTSGLWGDDRRLEERLALALRELRALDPDVVALQEASAGWSRGNVAARLAAGLGFHYVFAPATPRVLPVLGRLATWVMNFSEGSAVLSRFPIVSRAVTDLPRCVKFLDPRIMLRAEVDAPWGRVGIVSAHTARADCQLERIVDIVQGWPADRPAVVMGDLNTGETAPGLGVFSRAGMIDAFRAANPDGDGATTWQNVVGPARTARRRVDYVFLRSANGRQWRVVSSRIVLDEPERGTDGATLWPSDHYGVLADLELAPVQ